MYEYSDYRDLLRQFLDEHMSVEAFERTYIHKVKNEQRHLPPFVNATIQKLFGDVDALVIDPDLCQRLQVANPHGDYLTPDELRERVLGAWQDLDATLDK